MRQRVLLLGVAALLVTIAVFATGLRPSVLSIAYLAAVTPWLVAIDLRDHRLPNALVIPAIGLGLVVSGIEWGVSGRVPFVPLVAGAVYAASLFLLHVTGGTGMGDVKLAGALGLASWSVPVAALSPIIAFLVGGVVALTLLIAGHRRRRIAFGPYLLGGYWVAVAVGVAVRLGT